MVDERLKKIQDSALRIQKMVEEPRSWEKKRFLPIELQEPGPEVPIQRVVSYDGDELRMRVGTYDLNLNGQPRQIVVGKHTFWGWLAPVVHRDAHVIPEQLPSILGQYTLSHWVCPRNAPFWLHKHPWAETYINLGPGTFVCHVGGREKVLPPDESVYVPPNVINGGIALHDDCWVMIKFYFGLNEYLEED